jgi:radical SAM superfamily enzyme
MERYYSLNRYLRETFGEKLYKIALDGGFGCPNRDGTVGTGGCIFCSGAGSGDVGIAQNICCVTHILTPIPTAETDLPWQRGSADGQIASFGRTYLQHLYIPVQGGP